MRALTKARMEEPTVQKFAFEPFIQPSDGFGRFGVIGKTAKEGGPGGFGRRVKIHGLVLVFQVLVGKAGIALCLSEEETCGLFRIFLDELVQG